MKYIFAAAVSAFFLLAQQANSAEKSVEEVNQEAEELYSSGNYEDAFVILKNYRDKGFYDNQTLFLFGLSASNLNKNQEGIEAFSKLIESDPNANRVRLELAVLYLKNNEYLKAKEELLFVKKSENIPQEVMNKIDTLLTFIKNNEKKNKVFFANLSVSELYDNNVKYASVKNSININGLDFALEPRASDKATNYTALVGYDKDFNKKYGIYGFAYGNLLDYNRYNDNDALSFYSSNGVNIKFDNYKIYLPIVYGASWQDSAKFQFTDRILEFEGVAPSFTYFLSNSTALQTVVNLSKKEIKTLSNRDSFSKSISQNITHGFGRWILIFGGNAGIENSKTHNFSYTQKGLNSGIEYKIHKFTFSTYPSYNIYDYYGIEPITQTHRIDKNFTNRSTISYDLDESLNLALSNSFSNVSSNVAVYAYRKNQISLSLSWKY